MKLIKHRPSVFLTLFLLVSFTALQSQVLPLADSAVVEPIPFRQIPSSMAQTRIKTATLLEAIVSKEHLVNQQTINNSLSAQVHDRIALLLNQSEGLVNSRYVVNGQTEIKKLEERLNTEVDKMSEYINALDRADSYLKMQQTKWEVTNEALIKGNYRQVMLQRVSSMNTYLDSARTEIAERTELIFFILEQFSQTHVALEEASSELDASMSVIVEQLATIKNPSIFKLDHNAANVEFLVLVKLYLGNTIEDLKSYAELKRTSIIGVMVFFLILTYLFFSNRQRILSLYHDSSHDYSQKLGQILRSPISTAFVLTLALGSLVLKDRPDAVKSTMLYLSLLPLFILSREVIRKKFHKYVLFFFLLILPIIGFSVFPSDNIFYRFILLFSAICEFLVIGHLYMFHLRHSHDAQNKKGALVRTAVYALLLFVLIGFVGVISGRILIAQVLFLSTFNSVYVAAILYISVAIINGLFVVILESKWAQQVNALALNHQLLSQKIIKLINVLGVYVWVMVFLKKLGMWSFISGYVGDVFQYQWQIGEMHFTLGNIIIFILVIYISTLLARALQLILEGDVLNKMSLASGLPHSIAVMVRYAFVVLGVVLAASAVGLEFGNLAVIFGALGVGIGFGLQSIFNNLVSGLILLFERPIKIGDMVEIGTLIGKVKSIGIRSSNIHTVEGAEVIVPNGNLVSNEVINWTLSDQLRRIDVKVGVSYDSDPQEVKVILENVLSEHALILQDPKPSVQFMEMGESSLDFRMLFWTSSYSEWYRIRSEVVMKTFESLKANNIEIPFPQRVVSIKNNQDLPL